MLRNLILRPLLQDFSHNIFLQKLQICKHMLISMLFFQYRRLLASVILDRLS